MGVVVMAKKDIKKKMTEFVNSLLLRLGKIKEYKKNKFYSKPAKIKGSKDTAIEIFMKRRWYHCNLRIIRIMPEKFENGIVKISKGTPEKIRRIITEEYNEIMKGKITFYGLDEGIDEKVEFLGD